MKNKIFTFVLLILFFIGLSLLLYPTVSDYWNSFHQSRAIAGYAEAVEELDEEAYEKCLADARAYNAELVGDGGRFQPTAEETARYNSLLDIAGNGIMGYIEIPSIGVSLPVYHGVEQTVLQIAIGHIEGSSLPVGGPVTRARSSCGASCWRQPSWDCWWNFGAGERADNNYGRERRDILSDTAEELEEFCPDPDLPGTGGLSHGTDLQPAYPRRHSLPGTGGHGHEDGPDL